MKDWNKFYSENISPFGKVHSEEIVKDISNA